MISRKSAFTALMLEKHPKMQRMPEKKGDFMAVFSAFFCIGMYLFCDIVENEKQDRMSKYVLLCDDHWIRGKAE